MTNLNTNEGTFIVEEIEETSLILRDFLLLSTLIWPILIYAVLLASKTKKLPS